MINQTISFKDKVAQFNQKKIKVMVVDDAVLMRNAISMIIESNPNIEVVERAIDGQDALNKLRALPQASQPDVILTDIEMPNMDGLTFLKHARLRTKAKLVVISSTVLDRNSTQAQEAQKLGASAIISKPSGSISFDLQAKRSHEITQTIQRLAS